MAVNKRVRDKSIGRILVSFGGSDSGNATSRALASIAEVVPKILRLMSLLAHKTPTGRTYASFVI